MKETQRLWDYIDENFENATKFGESLGEFRQQVSRWNCKFKPPEHKGRWHSAIVHDGSIWMLCNYKRSDYETMEFEGATYRKVFTFGDEK